MPCIIDDIVCIREAFIPVIMGGTGIMPKRVLNDSVDKLRLAVIFWMIGCGETPCQLAEPVLYWFYQ